MALDILYTTKAKASGGREGKAATTDGAFSVKLDKPKELGGKDDGNNPEQLFAAGYAACYLGAMQFAASQNDDWDVPADTNVSAEVSLGKRDDGQGFGLAVTLYVALPGIDKSIAEKITDQAHIVCPYSHATKGNIEVKTVLEDA